MDPDQMDQQMQAAMAALMKAIALQAQEMSNDPEKPADSESQIMGLMQRALAGMMACCADDGDQGQDQGGGINLGGVNRGY